MQTSFSAGLPGNPDIAEAETGTMKLNIAEINLPELVNDVLDLYQIIAEEKKINLQTQMPDELHLLADRVRIQQALANLVDNAIKYTPEGGQVQIAISKADNQVEIAVKDNGRGIPDDELPRIWDRLYRGDKSRNEKGLGLGLSLVKAVVQAHQGSVEVASAVEQGSVFTMHLPLVPQGHTVPVQILEKELVAQ